MITNEDLTKDISTQELTQLSDINGKGELDQDIIDDCINDAISFVESFIILPSNPTPLLKKIVVDMTIYELRRKNDLVSDTDKELKKENEAYLTKMSVGKLKTEITPISTTPEPTTSSYAFRHRRKERVNLRGYR